MPDSDSPQALPAPLVPAEVDLRGYPYMPLHGDRLMASATWISATSDAKVAALRLWWHSYAHEVPAGSLPDDDRLLCDYAGYGVALRAWQRVRAQAMRGYILCSDGRWYHPVVCELAMQGWRERVRSRARQQAWRDRNRYVTVTPPVTPPLRNGREGEGEGEGEGKEKPSLRCPPCPTPPREPSPAPEPAAPGEQRAADRHGVARARARGNGHDHGHDTPHPDPAAPSPVYAAATSLPETAQPQAVALALKLRPAWTAEDAQAVWAHFRGHHVEAGTIARTPWVSMWRSWILREDTGPVVGRAERQGNGAGAGKSAYERQQDAVVARWLARHGQGGGDA